MTLGGKNFGEICAILVRDDPGFGVDLPEECWTSILANVHAVDVRHLVKCDNVTEIDHYCHMDEILQWRGPAIANAVQRKWDEAKHLSSNDTVPCASPLSSPQLVIPAPMIVNSDIVNEKEKSNHNSDVTDVALPMVTGILMLVIFVFIAVVWYCRKREHINSIGMNRYIAVRGLVEE